MTTRADKPSPYLEVLQAHPGELPIVANLLELYTHDFSEFIEIEMGADGRFGYRDLSLYWSEPDRHVFLLKADGRLAGFALVKRMMAICSGEMVWDMAEFFVVRGQRRRGIGVGAAREVWRRLPGQWQVRVMETNHAGQRFWRQAIAAFAGERMDSTCFEKGWLVFRFESRPTL